MLSVFLQKEHKTLLRPTLGHPNNKPELEKLKAAELSRQKDYEKSLDDYERLMMECENVSAKNFLKDLTQITVLLFSQFDVMLTLDEVIVGGTFISLFDDLVDYAFPLNVNFRKTLLLLSHLKNV